MGKSAVTGNATDSPIHQQIIQAATATTGSIVSDIRILGQSIKRAKIEGPSKKVIR